MTDATIKVGDVCHDLIERGKVQIVAKAADTVAEYREREDFDLAGYKAHPLLRVPDDDAVWTAVYLPEKPTTTFNGNYDFPESRLARVPVEAANQDLQRPQRGLATAILTGLFLASEDVEGADSVDVLAGLAEAAGMDPDTVSAARELADVEERFGEVDDAA